ncbi:PREDICTED: aspartic proteinase nepenthesin-1 [Tarenaya hassleriana]|uniref:aspartic proteinase nepenthesin-1 n=1 Tax=Tarenaya hassleriana TaxID=28532 RepID=UPI0008FD052F|nr:PREDICTED: aspartic proteinase nepenthesin-1 [Tarenaya hassleriana]
MMRREALLMDVILIFATVAALLSVSEVSAAEETAVRLPLYRRRSVSFIGDILSDDVNRHSLISRKRRLSSDGAVEMPLGSGRDFGTGQYLTELRVGTPSQKFTVVVDTGSELTWVNCRYGCRRNCTERRRKRRRVFRADQSSSFRTVACESQTCKIDLMNLFSLSTCPSPSSPCAYHYRYVDGSEAEGIFGEETVTVGLTNGRRGRVKGVLVGCSHSFSGLSFRRADGVLGLAFSRFSFASVAYQIYGPKFSYCLVDHLSHRNVSNYLVFGSGSNHSAHTRHTRLELDLISPFYAVNLVGISIDDHFLDIPPHVWDATRGGGTILDSGTSLTFLAEPAFRPLVSGLQGYVSRFKMVKLEGVPMEYCFSSDGFDEERMVPRVTFHFADGARFEPHRKSYVIDAAPSVKCLGFVSAGSAPATNVIGNIMQQNYLWEFDVFAKTLAFAPSTCS